MAHIVITLTSSKEFHRAQSPAHFSIIIVYANDLCELQTICGIALYTDDTVSYTANKDFSVSVSKRQADMVNLEMWCNTYGVMVNTDTTKLMVFGSPARLKSLPDFDIRFYKMSLQTVLSYKYLGVNLDSKLNYDKHMQKFVSKVSGKLKQFRHMSSFLNNAARV